VRRRGDRDPTIALLEVAFVLKLAFVVELAFIVQLAFVLRCQRRHRGSGSLIGRCAGGVGGRARAVARRGELRPKRRVLADR
jgi:hypothetical protein